MKRNCSEDKNLGLVHLVGHLGKGLVAVVIPGQAHQVGHNAGKALLEAGALLPGRFYGPVYKSTISLCRPMFQSGLSLEKNPFFTQLSICSPLKPIQYSCQPVAGSGA